MAPKKEKHTLGAPCAALKLQLLKDGGVNPDNMSSKALATLRNKAASSMVAFLKRDNIEKLNEYKRLESNKQRNEWMCEYFLDPESGGCLGKNHTEDNGNQQQRTRAITDENTNR